MGKTKRPLKPPPSDQPEKMEWVALADLHFDPDNPRFADLPVGKSEVEILDAIERRFGVEDVLSSIAANGYMSTEPLVGVRSAKGGVLVKEGNRRLAALLILAGDDRAKNHARVRRANPLEADANIDPVPVVVYAAGTEPEKLLPYLGVRHIVGSRPWDSYAKAAWVAHVLEEHGDTVTLEHIERMTGDNRGTVARLLEGYYLVKQLVAAGKFIPTDSKPKGRGSATEFPFSWVYNALGYKNVRDWLGMSEKEISPDPVPDAEHLENAASLFTFMFGKVSVGQQPVIQESRELWALAECIGDPTKVARLRNGVLARDVTWQSKAGLDRALESLTAASDHLDKALAGVSTLSVEDAGRVEVLAFQVREKARAVVKAVGEQKNREDD
jgi:hypothetical protein